MGTCSTMNTRRVPRSMMPFSSMPSLVTEPSSCASTGIGQNLRVARYADCASAQAFDMVMAALGLNVDQRTRRQSLAIYKFTRSHWNPPARELAIRWPLVQAFMLFQAIRPGLCEDLHTGNVRATYHNYDPRPLVVAEQTDLAGNTRRFSWDVLGNEPGQTVCCSTGRQ